jgi:hypothetical protein
VRHELESEWVHRESEKYAVNVNPIREMCRESEKCAMNVNPIREVRHECECESESDMNPRVSECRDSKKCAVNTRLIMPQIREACRETKSTVRAPGQTVEKTIVRTSLTSSGKFLFGSSTVLIELRWDNDHLEL